MERYSCFPNANNLDFWIHNNLNVLFFGKHGVGKTSLIIDSFKRNNLRFAIFSASTMDPWIDFIGVPKEKTDDKGSFLELVKPKNFRDDAVEALFFDELNRSHKKVRNAIMELIQFKSINGHVYKNLKFVWGAINPNDDESMKYQVEDMDPAQLDRFQIHVEIPYRPHAPYFREKYGRMKADAAIEWWSDLSSDMKNLISPRRLEYAIQIFESGGNLQFVLPPKSNISKLAYALANGSPTIEFERLSKANDEKNLAAWLENDNNFFAVENLLVKNPQNTIHLLSEEKIITLISKYDSLSAYIFANYNKFTSVIKNIAENSQNKDLRNAAIRCRVNNKETISIAKPETIDKISIKARNGLKALVKNYVWNPQSNVVFQKHKIRVYSYNDLQTCAGYAVTEAYTTTERLRIIHSVCNIIRLNQSTLIMQNAEQALSILDAMIAKTQQSTLQSTCENLVPTINTCINVLHANNRYKEIKEFVDKYPHISYKIIFLRQSLFNSYLAMMPRPISKSI